MHDGCIPPRLHLMYHRPTPPEEIATTDYGDENWQAWTLPSSSRRHYGLVARKLAWQTRTLPMPRACSHRSPAPLTTRDKIMEICGDWQAPGHYLCPAQVVTTHQVNISLGANMEICSNQLDLTSCYVAPLIASISQSLFADAVRILPVK